MFSYQRIWWPQAGQRERGAESEISGVSSIFTPSSSALSTRQPRSIISGRRWITTFRKLPIRSPSKARTSGDSKTPTTCESIDAGLDDLAELEDRQVHRDHDAA